MEGWPLYRTISLDPMITNLESISWRRPSHCQYENMKPGLKGMFTFELVILLVYDHGVGFPLYLAGPEMDSILLCVICSDIAVLLVHLIDCAKLFVTEWHFVFIFTQEYPPPPSPLTVFYYSQTLTTSRYHYHLLIGEIDHSLFIGGTDSTTFNLLQRYL